MAGSRRVISVAWSRSKSSSSFCVVLAACGGASHSGSSGATLAATLERDVGAGQSVAIIPGRTLRAISADGARERVLAPGPVSWVLVDQRAHVIWFGGADRSTISVLDLDAPPATDAVVIATGLPSGPAVTISYPPSDDLAFGHPIDSHVVLELDPPHLAISIGGFIDAGGDQLSHATLEHRELLTAFARRGGRRTTHSPAPDSAKHRVDGVDSKRCERDPKACGQAEAIPGTQLWRVTVAYTCGDGCYAEQRIYDPATQQFIAGAWTDELQDAWVAPDGSAFVRRGVVIRFDSGPLLVTPAGGIEGGGWLGSSYYAAFL